MWNNKGMEFSPSCYSFDFFLNEWVMFIQSSDVVMKLIPLLCRYAHIWPPMQMAMGFCCFIDRRYWKLTYIFVIFMLCSVKWVYCIVRIYSLYTVVCLILKAVVMRRVVAYVVSRRSWHKHPWMPQANPLKLNKVIRWFNYTWIVQIERALDSQFFYRIHGIFRKEKLFH